ILGKLLSSFGFPNDQISLVVISGAILFLTFLFKAIFGIFINYKIVKFGFAQQLRLRSKMTQSYQSIPYSKYINRNSSEYIHSLKTLVSQYTDLALIPFLKIISDSIVALLIVIYLAFTNVYVLMLLISLFSLMIFGYDKIFRKKARSYGENSNKAATSMVNSINESIKGLAEIRILKKESFFQSKISKEAKKFGDNEANIRILTSSTRYLLELLLVGFVVLLVTIILYIGDNLQTLIPILAIFGVASLRLLPSINSLSSNLVNMRFARNAVSLLKNDLEYIRNVEIKKRQNINKNISNTGDFNILKVENISYSYEGSKSKAIENVSFELKRGESIGIIGSSGSGKTTLINLLLGLLNPDSGNIFINKTLLNENIDNWQSQVAFIPQTLLIVDDTLKINITMSDDEKNIDYKRLSDSIVNASLKNLVKKLKLGVDTVLGEGGAKLSGGERQRVILARAFYHNRNILVMDESTSSLDDETEQEITREIKKLHREKTMIVIAHRHSTLAHCDKIYRMEAGKIIDQGTPEKMLKK
ncbi:ABC transporter ATP-binding protein/permease, partial [Methylophilaceae bacterium]|nr:ABC transporter ATP-binding protein/permease [Methylophilaceae bacterium]